jgi:hypothetical protein
MARLWSTVAEMSNDKPFRISKLTVSLFLGAHVLGICYRRRWPLGGVVRELADIASEKAEIWGFPNRRYARQGMRRWEIEVMKVKHSNWFAAGPEVSRALMLLSDGAFRLYFYLCLHAGRDDGSVAVSYFAVAHALGKSRRSIATYFDELKRNGVCRIDPAVNQHQNSKIEICDEFWPYTRPDREPNSSESESYFLRVRSLLAARACVKCAFGAADQKLAAVLLAREVPLQQIERAIALGCARKYVSLLNGTDSGPIVTLSYFRDLIEEAGDQETPAGYWDYLKPELEHIEAKWIEREKLAGANIASAAAQKSEETR